MAVLLNYAGSAGVGDMGAFNARLYFTWKGDHLFRIYPLEGYLYFIRISGSRRSSSGIAVGGLLGMLINHFVNKHQQKVTAQTLNQIAGVDPRQLMSGHKLNFAVPVDQVQSAEITAGTFWSSVKFGRLRMTEGGKKRKMSFDDVENMRLAVDALPAVLGERAKIKVEWNPQKQKFKNV